MKQNESFEFEFFKGKFEKIRFIKNPKKPFCANGGIFGIKVDDLFFNELNSKEKVAALWHEYYHKLKNSTMLPLFELKSIFGLRFNYNHKIEFEADKFSALNNSIEDCLKLLYKTKELYTKYNIKYNPKTHPPIEERIKLIKQLIK